LEPPHSLPLLIPSDHPPYTLLSHYDYYHHHHYHHHFRSRFHKWVRTCDLWPFQLVLLSMRCPLPSIFLQMTSFHFYLWLSNIFHGVWVCIRYTPDFLVHSLVVGHLGWILCSFCE
jgi:hypothetical protein